MEEVVSWCEQISGRRVYVLSVHTLPFQETIDVFCCSIIPVENKTIPEKKGLMQCIIYYLYGAKNEYLRTFNKIIHVSAISNPVEKNYKIPKCTAELEFVIVTP